jgi:hypothetical protein
MYIPTYNITTTTFCNCSTKHSRWKLNSVCINPGESQLPTNISKFIRKQRLLNTKFAQAIQISSLLASITKSK